MWEEEKVKIVRRQKWEVKVCPFCCHKLDTMGFIKRKVIKIYTCRHCKKTIDERYIVW